MQRVRGRTPKLPTMSVYVDESIWPFGRMMMCHLMGDSLEELHRMADTIGVARRWFQNAPGTVPSHKIPHYDICKSKRVLAVEAGALEVDRRGTVAIMEEWRARNLVANALSRPAHPSRAESGSGVRCAPPGAAGSPRPAGASQDSGREAGGASRDFLRRRGKIKHPLRWICMARCIADPDTIMGELQSLGLVSDLCAHWWEVAEVDARRVEGMLLARAQ